VFINRLRMFGLPAATLLAGWLLFRSMTGHAINQGELALDFTLPDIQPDRPPISLQDHRGKIVYVDFWASWCAPCLRSLPQINELYNRYRDQGFEVLAVNVDNPIEDGLDFLLDVDLDYLIPADTDNKVMEMYKVVGMPTSYLIDREGYIRKVHTGFREGDIEILEKALLELL
jgi:cytochrome c biogenesis protein CcmG, thiol:disulfide interchange protein DsbE